MKALRTTDHKIGSYLERRLSAEKLPGSDMPNPGPSSMNAGPSSDAAIPDTRVAARMNLHATSVHQLLVDHSEGRSALLDAVRRSGMFEVRMAHLATGDYLIDSEVLIERKSVADFAASLLDGRLFPQVARLAHSGYRSLLLIEGPASAPVPKVHPHSLEGALVSMATLWRVPVLHSSDSEQSVRMLRFAADQVQRPQERILRRFDRKPKRLASRRLFLLQALPGVGPTLAHRLLERFGSVERVFTADASALAEARGIGPKKAARIRELIA
jgi:DNA excision repair protein ERCC-4